jgi:hypothetical protein
LPRKIILVEIERQRHIWMRIWMVDRCTRSAQARKTSMPELKRHQVCRGV